MPPSLFSQPNITTFRAASMAFAPSLTSKTTIKNTIANASTGSHLWDILVVSLKYWATTADNFSAAARPIINASKENTATTKPFRHPLIMAKTRRHMEMMSINTSPDFDDMALTYDAIACSNHAIGYLPASKSFTLAEIAFPSARPASFLVATPITFPMSAGLEAPVSEIICRNSFSSSSSLNC